MAFLPKQQTALERRVLELHRDGYVKAIAHSGEAKAFWQLTEKGWAVLAACADRPVHSFSFWKPPRNPLDEAR